MSAAAATLILAVQGASNLTIQALLSAFARRWSASGVSIVCAVEEPGRVIQSAMLRDLADGRLYPVHQDLGAGSKACQLDGSSVAGPLAIVAAPSKVVLDTWWQAQSGERPRLRPETDPGRGADPGPLELSHGFGA